MKLLLLGGNPGFWHHTDRPHDRNIMSGIEAWVFAFDGDHCNTLDATQELVNRYDLIIGNTNRGAYRPKLLELQRNRKKGIRWVTLIEASASEYLALDNITKEILDGSDLVNVINRNSLDFFRFCTSTRCEYIGIPYPADHIRKTFLSENRRDVWLPSNLYSLPASWSSALAAIPVTKKFGTHAHGFFRKDTPAKLKKSFITRKKKLSEGEKENILLRDIFFHHEMNMPEYFQTLSNTGFAFMNLDHRFTWARDVLDCAALQIPCIATPSTGHAEVFFPNLLVRNEFAVREASELLDRLYSDRAFYDKCANIPIERLEHLSPQNMKQKLLESLGI